MLKNAKFPVFLVDDDPAMRRLLSAVVDSIGMAATPFSSAEEFLQAYRPSGPSCLVLDMRMPGMSGMELLDRLTKADGSMLPVIFISAYADVRLAVQAMEKGGFSFLEKPFRPQELAEKIRAAMEVSQTNWRRHRKNERLREALSLLTPAERKVADLVVAGATNKAAAEQLGLSARTVEVHLARIMKKLKVSSRVKLVRLVQDA